MRIERPKAMRLLRLRTLHKIAYKAARLKGAATRYNCVARVAADVHRACSKRAGANLKITADLPVCCGWRSACTPFGHAIVTDCGNRACSTCSGRRRVDKTCEI